jgi:ADP-ribosylglycohydrolase
MPVLLKILRVALITHKTVAAVAATVVISVGVYEYLRNTNRRNK